MKAICKFCQQEFEMTMWGGKPSFPSHRDAQDAQYACEGMIGSFEQVAVNANDFKPVKRIAEPKAKKFEGLHLVKPDNGKPAQDAIQEKFLIFHDDNPKIYEILVKFAREAKQAGMKKFAIRPIVERARWFVEVETRGDDFKINNDFCGRYARMIMKQEPDLGEFFETRELTAQTKAAANQPEYTKIAAVSIRNYYEREPDWVD